MPPVTWYCQFDDKADGPYSFDELVYLVRRNQLVGMDCVRQGEEGDWITASRVPGLFSSTPTPKDLPKENVPEPIKAELAELDEVKSEVPKVPELPPKPFPNEGSIVGRNIAIGAAALALLLLLLLPLLFVQGDGGRGTVKGNGGNASGTGSGTGGSGVKAGGRAGETNTDGADNSQGFAESAQSSAAIKKSGTTTADSSSDRETPEKPIASTGQGSVPTEDQKNATTEKRKLIPVALGAIAYDAEDHNATPQASPSQSDSGGAKGGSGTEGAFFGIKAKGRHFVYIVDCSSSMNGGPFARVCEELILSIKNLTKSQSFYVFFFNQVTIPMFEQPKGGMLQATRKNIHRLEAWVNTAQAVGGTDPTNALVQALKMKPDAIFLLTDGEIPENIPGILINTNSRRVPPSSRIKKVRSSRKAITPINTIGFENTAGETILKQIATENDGEYRFIPGSGYSAPARPNFPFLPTHP